MITRSPGPWAAATQHHEKGTQHTLLAWKKEKKYIQKLKHSIKGVSQSRHKVKQSQVEPWRDDKQVPVCTACLRNGFPLIVLLIVQGPSK